MDKQNVGHLYMECFPGGSAGKESTCNARDLSLIPGLERSPGEGKCCPLQYSGLENSMDCIVHRVTKSQTRPSNFQKIYLIVKGLLQKILKDTRYQETK